MPVSLDFATSHHYTGATDGIYVPITLWMGKQSVELLAKLDTGAAHCIFERKYAQILGLEVESGRPLINMRSQFQTLGIEFPAVVFFAQDPIFSRNFLGRSGWLDRLRIGIVDYDRMLFVGPYQP